MYTDDREKLRLDIIKTIYMQLQLQISVADLMSAKKDYKHFRLVNAIFVDAMEKYIDSNIKDAAKADEYKELLEANSTFALFINDCAAAEHVYDKLDNIISKYEGLSFDFSSLSEDDRTRLLVIDRWQDSEVFLKLYDNYGTELADLLTNSTPKFNFKKNLEKVEEFIEDKTKVNITSDKETIDAVKTVFDVKTDADIDNILIGGIISPRDIRSDGEQAEIFMYNRIASLSSYKDLLQEQVEYMSKKWGVEQLGSTIKMLELADEIVKVYEEFVGEPMKVDAYYYDNKETCKSAIESWCLIQENYGTNETYELVVDLYTSHCDEWFDVDYEVRSTLDYKHCMA